MNNHLLLVVFTVAAIALNDAAARAEPIRVGGTGAALGLMRTLAAAYEAQNADAKTEILPSLGSSGGIAAVGAGKIAVGIAGRLPTPEERAKGIRAHRWVSTPYAFVTSHRQADSLRSEDVVAIFSGARSTWSDGSRIRIILRSRGDSMTRALVRRFPGIDGGLESMRKRKEIPVAPTDQDNIELAERIQGSLTLASLTQVKTERPRVEVMSLDGVMPSVEALTRGTYTLASELFLIVREEPSPGAKSFLDFLMSSVAAPILEANGAVLQPAT